MQKRQHKWHNGTDIQLQRGFDGWEVWQDNEEGDICWIEDVSKQEALSFYYQVRAFLQGLYGEGVEVRR